MTIALVQQKPNASYVSTYAGTISDSFASLPAIGNLVIVSGGAFNGTPTFAVSDNQGHTYTTVANPAGDSAIFIAFAVVTASSGTFTVTATNGGQRSATLNISEWSGAATSSVAGNYSVSGISMSRTADTTVSGQLAIAVAGGNGTGGNYTEPFTLMDEDILANCIFSVSYKICGAPATETAAWTGTLSSDSNNTAFALFMPGASGPTVTSVTQTSGGTEGSPAVMTVALSGATSGSTNFAATLAGVTATGSGTDFTSDLASATYSNGVTFSGGNMVVPDAVSGWTVTIATTSDTLDEADETATLTVGGTAGTLTITDDDVQPTVTISDATEVAGTVTFVATLSAASGKTITFVADTADGTKTAGVDYTALTGSTVTFNPGETTKNIVVTAL